MFDYTQLSLDGKVELLYDLYEEIKDHIKSENREAFERWKSGGFTVDTNVATMYPNLKEVWETLEDSNNEESDED